MLPGYRVLTRFAPMIITLLLFSLLVQSACAFPYSRTESAALEEDLWLSAVEAGDLDGDGLFDLVVATSNGTLLLYYQQPEGTLSPSPIHLSAPNRTGDLVVRDMDGDGRSDILAASPDDARLILYYQQPDGTFSIGNVSIMSTGHLPVRMVVEYINGDSLPDIAVACLVDNSTMLYFQRPDGSFNSTSDVKLDSPSFPLSVDVGDMNGDTLPDIAVGTIWPGEALLYYQLSGGTFHQSPDMALSYSGLSQVSISDLDGNGLDDLLVLNGGDAALSVHYQDASGLSGLPDDVFALSGDSSHMLRIADLNNDTYLDIAVAMYGVEGEDTVHVLPVQLFFGNDTGALATGDNMTLKYSKGADLSGTLEQMAFNLSMLPQMPPAIAVGDMNADGLNDLVAAFNDTGSILIFRQESDMDRDGYPDWLDVFSQDPFEWADTDGDGMGDNVDTDDDSDGYSDNDEIACGSNSLDNTSLPVDTDGDMSPDCIDPDDDGDGYNDVVESALGADPKDKSSKPLDTDGDGTPDALDIDDDNDDVPDQDDAFPTDPSRSKDDNRTLLLTLLFVVVVVVVIVIAGLWMSRKRGCGEGKDGGNDNLVKGGREGIDGEMESNEESGGWKE